MWQPLPPWLLRAASAAAAAAEATWVWLTAGVRSRLWPVEPASEADAARAAAVAAYAVMAAAEAVVALQWSFLSSLMSLMTCHTAGTRESRSAFYNVLPDHAVICFSQGCGLAAGACGQLAGSCYLCNPRKKYVSWHTMQVKVARWQQLCHH